MALRLVAVSRDGLPLALAVDMPRSFAWCFAFAAGCVGASRDDPEPNVALARYELVPTEHVVLAPERPTPSRENAAFVGYARAPVLYVGAVASVEATVAEVISDRAFWLDGDGRARVLAVLREDLPHHGASELSPGQRIRFDAVVLPSSAARDLGTLDEEVHRAIADAGAFLAIDWTDVTVLPP